MTIVTPINIRLPPGTRSRIKENRYPKSMDMVSDRTGMRMTRRIPRSKPKTVKPPNEKVAIIVGKSMMIRSGASNRYWVMIFDKTTVLFRSGIDNKRSASFEVGAVVARISPNSILIARADVSPIKMAY